MLWFTCQRVCMCGCVCLDLCPPSRALIASGVTWYDIDCVRLVKQVLCFQLLYLTLAINKMDGLGLINTAHPECLPKKTNVMQY